MGCAPAGQEVRVVAYDPAWPLRFRALAGRARAALGGLALRVEHVGSTAVPGLAAKPVIDLDVVVRAADLALAIERLAGLGYRHQGENGIPGREAFRWPPGEARHHLYLCPQDSAELRRHLLFRDHLRAEPAVAEAYARLKRRLAQRHGMDRQAYQDGKAGFIAAALRAAGEQPG